MQSSAAEIEDDHAQSLLARVAKHDESAMRQLYRLFENPVYAFALRRLNHEGDAEDIVVETMYEVWRCAGKFQARSRVKTWVLGIAKHKLLDRMRKSTASVDVELDEDLASDEPDSYAWLAARQQARHVAHCLDTLPPSQRECLYLVFFHGLSLAEVARLEECPENTVKTRVFHAKRKIRQCLEVLLQ